MNMNIEHQHEINYNSGIQEVLLWISNAKIEDLFNFKKYCGTSGSDIILYILHMLCYLFLETKKK